MFILGKRARLLQEHFVSRVVLSFRVMGLVVLAAPESPLITGMLLKALHLDHDGLFHFVGSNDSLKLSSCHRPSSSLRE